MTNLAPIFDTKKCNKQLQSIYSTTFIDQCKYTIHTCRDHWVLSLESRDNEVCILDSLSNIIKVLKAGLQLDVIRFLFFRWEWQNSFRTKFLLQRTLIIQFCNIFKHEFCERFVKRGGCFSYCQPCKQATLINNTFFQFYTIQYSWYVLE